MSEAITGLVTSKRKDRTAVKVDDTWYNGAQPAQVEPLNNGDKITFYANPNDKGGKDVGSDIAVLEKAQRPGGAGGYKGGGAKGGGKAYDDSGMTAGAAVNQACLLIAHGAVKPGKGKLIEVVTDLSTQLAKVSTELKASLKAGKPAESAAPPAKTAPPPSNPPPTAAPTQAQVDQADDDIPF